MASVKKVLSIEGLNLVAARFKVLSEPIRLQILQQLEGGPMNVSDLMNAVRSTQPNVSKHLRILKEAGLVSRRQEGNTVFFSIEDESVFALCEVVCDSLKETFAQQNKIFR